ncbi:MAG: hypothetical protein NC489_42465 [Ruminococcus flavefaciens]|nr:hypothetical protein [Ruminococcus flavefaciens]
MTMTKEQARASLVLFHDISDPTERQIAMFIIYGENAPFLGDKEPTRAASINISGGHQMKDLQGILIGIRGTKKLLSMLCTEATTITDHDGNNLQEALFSIEDMLQLDIEELEKFINAR